MAITFNCAQCGKMVRIGDEYAGRKGRCPSCLAVIDIPGASAAAVAPILEIPNEREPTPGRIEFESLPGPAGAAWKGVYGGLGFVFGGSLTMAVTLVALLVLAFLMVLLAGPRAENVIVAGVCVGLITGIFGLVLFLVGVCRCCSAPSESGAHGAAVVTAFCACFATVVLLIAIITQVAEGRDPKGRRNPNPDPFGQQRMGRAELSPAVQAMQLIAQVFVLGTEIALTIFLGRVGRYFNNDTLAASSFLLLIFFVVLNVLGFAFGLAVDPGDLQKEPMYLLFGLLLLAGFLAVFVWFLILVYQARAAIHGALRRPPAWDEYPA